MPLKLQPACHPPLRAYREAIVLEKVIGNCCFYLVPRSGHILYRHDRRCEGFFGGTSGAQTLLLTLKRGSRRVSLGRHVRNLLFPMRKNKIPTRNSLFPSARTVGGKG